MYGLKQAPCACFGKLRTWLLHWGFSSSWADASLFYYKSGASFIAVLLDVDDIIITGNDSQLIHTIIKQLNSAFALKELGPLHYFLGIQVSCNQSGSYLSQTKYITDLL